MIAMPALQTELLDLLHELHGTDVKVIIGGGFGIYLKTEHVRRLEVRTLLRQWPEPRSTSDLDLFLRPELLIEPVKLKPLAEAITRLGYKVVKGAEKYQFVKSGRAGDKAGSIKIDILTGPQNRFEGTSVKTDSRRARPNPSVGIHAHPVDEALTLEEGLLSVFIDQKSDTSEPAHGQVFLPQPYTFLMMKLFAFRDRIDDADKEFGRYHALDLYTILATTMESEWKQALLFRDRYRNDSHVVEAGQLVVKFFSAIR